MTQDRRPQAERLVAALKLGLPPIAVAFGDTASRAGRRECQPDPGDV